MKTIETKPVPYIPPFAPTVELGEHARVLKALGEPMRLSVVLIIAARNGEAVCACDFPDALGVSQPTASHHLKKLTDVGLLRREQRGKWAWFSLVPERLDSIQQFIETLKP